MLFKLKSVLYPPNATAINRRRYKITPFFLAVAYEHCISMKHFRFGDKIETSLNLFFFIYFQASEFSRPAFGCHENSDPGKQINKHLVSPNKRLNNIILERTIEYNTNQPQNSTAKESNATSEFEAHGKKDQSPHGLLTRTHVRHKLSRLSYGTSLLALTTVNVVT